MIVLDTNVISELWNDVPDTHVLHWWQRQIAEHLYLCSITVAELQFGLEIMSAGKRRSHRLHLLENELLPAFAHRLLPFDLQASRLYGSIRANARKNGITLQPADGYIAATAASRSFAIATRDNDFAAAGVRVINPWYSTEHG